MNGPNYNYIHYYYTVIIDVVNWTVFLVSPSRMIVLYTRSSTLISCSGVWLTGIYIGTLWRV